VPKSVLAMSDINFRDVFSKAMSESPSPYAYQSRLACEPDASLQDIDSLRSRASCHSQLINIPTGLGKTAAVVLAWLSNRVLQRAAPLSFESESHCE
jgi:CRISPR-associated endonuclease/helicase Cas3